MELIRIREVLGVITECLFAEIRLTIRAIKWDSNCPFILKETRDITI
jgi:hypothetical protein